MTALRSYISRLKKGQNPSETKGLLVARQKVEKAAAEAKTVWSHNTVPLDKRYSTASAPRIPTKMLLLIASTEKCNSYILVMIFYLHQKMQEREEYFIRR